MLAPLAGRIYDHAPQQNAGPLGSSPSITRVPFTVDEFAALRPFLYHVTARENLGRLSRTMLLEPAAGLIARSDTPDLLRRRRDLPVAIAIAGETVVLKDQRPLVKANVQLEDGWVFQDFVQFLNEHVFFWPGDAVGPIVAGKRLLAHYAAELPLTVRVKTRELLASNPSATPLFSPYNSGAPRMQRGKPVSRGPGLFKPAPTARRRRHEVLEVVFREPLILPSTAQIPGENESWVSLAAAT